MRDKKNICKESPTCGKGDVAPCLGEYFSVSLSRAMAHDLNLKIYIPTLNVYETF